MSLSIADIGTALPEFEIDQADSAEQPSLFAWICSEGAHRRISNWKDATQ